MDKGGDEHLIFPGDGESTKPRSLIHALSEIEQFSVAEMNSEIPEGAMTVATGLSFFEVGIKSGLLNGLVTVIMTPLMMAAGAKLIPIFGDKDPTLFDRLFSVALSVSFSICYALFIFTILSRSYIGNVTRKATNNLVAGLSSGIISKAILSYLIFHFLQIKILTQENIVTIIKKLQDIPFLSRYDYNALYQWMTDFSKVFVPSAYFVIVISMIFTSIVVSAVIIGMRRTKRRRIFLEEWE